MKYATLLPLLSGVAAATPAHMDIHKRQGFLGGLVGGVVNSGYGRVPDVPGAAPRKVVMKSRTEHLPDAKTVKIRYGPYKVPNANKKNFMGESGTLYNYPDVKVEKPCEECVLIGINAGLEYPDGRDANTAEGLWLHHMVLLNVGAGRMDPTCVGKTSLPHMVVGSDAAHSERVFSSGNERSRVLFTPPFAPDAKLGYYMNKGDQFRFIVDLMNMNPEDKVLYMTLTYDYIEGRPKGFDNMKAIWLDAAQCGTSEVFPPKQTGNFVVSASWTANIEGEILGAGGHVHDGGTHLTLSVDGKVVCDSVATYGAGKAGMGGMSPAGGGGMGGMAAGAKSVNGGANGAKGAVQAPAMDAPGGHAHGGVTEHITKMSGCQGDKMGIGKLVKGQKWLLQAYYDYDKHSGMKNSNGRQENIMGIAIMYIKNPKV